MNKIFRLFWTAISVFWRSKIHYMDVCETPFRVWPTDLDVLMHMNNGIYLSLQDLARVDLMQRCGAAKIVSAEKMYPVVVAQRIRYKRSLQLFQKFVIRTQMLGWDDKYFYLSQSFHSPRAGLEDKPFAESIIKARFLKVSGGGVIPQDLIWRLEMNKQSPSLPGDVLGI